MIRLLRDWQPFYFLIFFLDLDLDTPLYLGLQKIIFLGSSVAEQSAVNRSVVGSNPTRGATNP